MTAIAPSVNPNLKQGSVIRSHQLKAPEYSKSTWRGDNLASTVYAARITEVSLPRTFCDDDTPHILANSVKFYTKPQNNVKTTMIYTHVLNLAGKAVRSPLDG